MIHDVIEKIKALSNENLVSKMSLSWNYEKRLKSIFLVYINEIYDRKLYAEGPYPSMFSYLTKALDLSEPTASKRLSAARLARRVPELYDLIESGEISITAASMISRTTSNDMALEEIREIIDRSRKKSIRQIEIDLSQKNSSGIKSRDYVKFGSIEKQKPKTSPETADQKPLAENPSLIQNSPLFADDANDNISSDRSEDSNPTEMKKDIEDALARISFTAPKKVYEDLCRVKEILSNKYPKAQMADIFSEVLEFFLKHKDPNRKPQKEQKSNKKASTLTEEKSVEKPLDGPSSSEDQKSRYIPQSVKTTVYQRDGGQCAYKDSEGRRCCARTMLEYDHIIPYGMGGSSSDPQNIRLLCKTHNLLEAKRSYGENKIKEKISKIRLSQKSHTKTFFEESLA